MTGYRLPELTPETDDNPGHVLDASQTSASEHVRARQGAVFAFGHALGTGVDVGKETLRH